MPLRLKWSRTWDDDTPEDFVCHDKDGNLVGRIYSTHNPEGGKWWLWALNGQIPGTKVWLHQNGHTDTKMEAAEAAEATYFHILRKHRKMPAYERRQDLEGMWEVYDTATGQVIVMDGAPLSGLDDHEAREAIELLEAGEIAPDSAVGADQ